MPSNSRKPKPKTYSMYPALHSSVSDLLQSEADGLNLSFYHTDTDQNCTKYRDTNIMGRFTCHNGRCSMDGWTSKKIAITIRMYPRGRYNARVYHQRCKGCNWVIRPQLDDSYAERVTYWLLKWNGVDVQAPSHGGKSNAPHNRVLCEGCKAGHCNG